MHNERLALLYNAWKELGLMLDDLQPGLATPVPPGDPNEVDAMKILWLAGQIRRGLA